MSVFTPADAITILGDALTTGMVLGLAVVIVRWIVQRWGA